MKRVALVLLLSGCPAIYSAQYDDRKAQLELNRDLFLPGSDDVSDLSTGGARVYWIDTTQAVEHAVAHSQLAGQPQVDYSTFSPGTSFTDGEGRVLFSLGDQLIANCDGTVFEAATGGSAGEFPNGDDGEEPCFVYGDDVHYIDNGAGSSESGMPNLAIWNASSNVATSPFSLADLQINTSSVFAFGPITATTYLFAEGQNVWLIDHSGPAARTQLNQGVPALSGGGGTFDDEGVVFATGTQDGSASYVRYADPTDIRSVNAMIADGGYDLNFENGDIQDPSSTDAYTLWNHKLIYQATGGIFALDMETGYVSDILLDGREDQNTDTKSPNYGPPQITSDGQLYVQDADFESTKAVYHVDLNVVLH